MDLTVCKELLVLGSWFTALETHRKNGPDYVQRVAGSWFLVHGFGNTQREWTWLSCVQRVVGSLTMVLSHGNTHWEWSWLGKMDKITDWNQKCCSQFMVTCSCFAHKEWVLVVSWIMDQMGQWIIVLWGFIYACMCLPEHLEAVSALLMWYYPDFFISADRNVGQGFTQLV